MPHVQQRFLVHCLVLENRKNRICSIQQGMTRLIELRRCQRFDNPSIGFLGKSLDGRTTRPLSRTTLAA
jgi:hypothetical protein